MKKIVFVGLSDKEGKMPFDSSTSSGRIIKKIEDALQNEYTIYKRNLVAYAPLDAKGKLRYPTKLELDESYQQFLLWINRIKPSFVFLFGKIVGEKVQNEDIPNAQLFRFLHPSYIWVYKKKEMETYIQKIVNSIPLKNK